MPGISARLSRPTTRRRISIGWSNRGRASARHTRPAAPLPVAREPAHGPPFGQPGCYGCHAADTHLLQLRAGTPRRVPAAGRRLPRRPDRGQPTLDQRNDAHSDSSSRSARRRARCSRSAPGAGGLLQRPHRQVAFRRAWDHGVSAGRRWVFYAGLLRCRRIAILQLAEAVVENGGALPGDAASEMGNRRSGSGNRPIRADSRLDVSSGPVPRATCGGV